MKTEIKNKVQNILEETTGIKIKNFDLNREIQSQIKLDSIKIVELFSALENEFKIELPLTMMNVKNAKEFLDFLEIELEKKA